jgi:hypothetical protein
MPTTFPLIAAGWRGAVGWANEAGNYGVAPTSTAYNWVGAVQNAKGTADKQPIFVYRMDGSTNYPAYLLKGIKNVDFTITYWPQPLSNSGVLSDLGLLVDDINNIGVNTNSHSFIIKDFDTNATYTITGAIANQVRISGKAGNALEVEVTYWCQNILKGLPTGATFPTDPGIAHPICIPFFFSQENIQIPTGSPQVQTLTFTATITNNLQRVPQFGTDVIRSIPTLLRKADGVLTATFNNLTDFPNEVNVSNIQGTTTSASGTVLTDTNQSFTVNAFIGMTLTYFTGPAAGQKQVILSNTATTITTAAFSPVPTGGGGDAYLVDLDSAPSGLSQQEISLKLGILSLPATTYWLTYTGAVLPKIDLTMPIADLVALDLPWTATGATVHI